MFNRLAAVEHFIIAFTGAVPAEHAVVHSALASVVDALAAAVTVDAPARTPGQIFRVKFYADLLYDEKFSFAHHLIGFKLLAVQITWISAERFGFFTGIIARHDTHRPFRFEIDKSGRNFSVIEVFQRPLTQAASRNQAHGVRCATLNFNKDQEAFGVPYRVLDPPNQFRDTTADEGRRLLQIVQLQVLRLVASAYPLGISMAANHPGRVDETWRRTVFAFRGLSVRWDARTEDYIVTARDHSSRTGGRNSLPTA